VQVFGIREVGSDFRFPFCDFALDPRRENCAKGDGMLAEGASRPFAALLAWIESQFEALGKRERSDSRG
jgi:hypothetical protein